MVKRYARREADAALALAYPSLVISALSRVEVPAALWKKVRVGELAQVDALRLVPSFEADYGGVAPIYVAVPVDRKSLDRAAAITGQDALRTGDAIQLASALLAREVEPGLDTFLCFDARLCEAAARHGFEVVGR